MYVLVLVAARESYLFDPDFHPEIGICLFDLMFYYLSPHTHELSKKLCQDRTRNTPGPRENAPEPRESTHRDHNRTHQRRGQGGGRSERAEDFCRPESPAPGGTTPSPLPLARSPAHSFASHAPTKRNYFPVGLTPPAFDILCVSSDITLDVSIMFLLSCYSCLEVCF